MGKIPKLIFQSWKTKNLDDKMSEAVKTVQRLNPEYKYTLFDDQDCRSFLLKHFNQNFLNAFDAIVPGAFKCDFWRYCVLYIHGGIYIDIDMVPQVPFREMIGEEDEFVSVADRDVPFVPNCNIYQAFMAIVPRHPIMYHSLMLSFYNIASRRYDIFDSFSITGPVVVGIAMNLYLGNKKTTSSFNEPGEFPKNIRLHLMTGKWTVNKDDKKLIKNSFEGYDRGPLDYSTRMQYYIDDPRYGTRLSLFWIFIGVVILVIVIGVIVWIVRNKWKKCENECVMKSSSSD